MMVFRAPSVRWSYECPVLESECPVLGVYGYSVPESLSIQSWQSVSVSSPEIYECLVLGATECPVLGFVNVQS